MKFPPIKKTWPLSVLQAKPFWPQRIKRRGLPVTFESVIEAIAARVVRLKD